MNILNLISEIEKVDPEVYERLDQRRQMFKHFAGFGKKLTAAAVPLAMGSMFQKAYGQSSGLSKQIIDVLNFALTLEYLEYYFYDMGVNTRNLFVQGDLTAITKIRDDERNHVMFLKAVLGANAIADPTPAAFDYTGSKGGKRASLVPEVFRYRDRFLALAQAFEDTGVRAYKGGAPLLMSNNTVLLAALNIHSVEARHVSHIRTMRRGGVKANGDPKSWISGGGNDHPSFADPVYGPGNPANMYPPESNITQAGIDLTMFPNVTANEAAEAFDEPLDMGTVLAIAGNFFV